MDTEELAKRTAFYVGPYCVTHEDIAKAWAVQDARGEEMEDAKARAVRIEEVKDILNRAFRYAQTRQQTDRTNAGGSTPDAQERSE